MRSACPISGRTVRETPAYHTGGNTFAWGTNFDFAEFTAPKGQMLDGRSRYRPPQCPPATGEGHL
jgi:hypothetical protein